MVDGGAAVDLELALLHHAGGLVPDAVAELAGLVRGGRHPRTVRIEQVVYEAAVGVRVAQSRRRRGRRVDQHWN